MHIVGFVTRNLLICYKSQPGDDPVVSNRAAVSILYRVALDGFWITPFISVTI